MNGELLQVKKAKDLYYFKVISNQQYLKTKDQYLIPFDYIVREPKKVAAHIQSKLGLNERVFARKCVVKKITKEVADQFLNQYHLMNSTQCASAYALFYKEELLAVSTFSAGRKMNRLKENQRSFELIRFCCKSGITIPGGLSKLLKHFVKEKNADDVMTYVDRHFSEGEAFTKAGFKIHSRTPSRKFWIHKKSGEREIYTTEKENKSMYFVMEDLGNVKMIYTPNEKV